jgi:hypothetical protein
MTSNTIGSTPLGEPSDLTGEWYDKQECYFWHDEDPLVVKYAIEKMTGTLLTRELADSQNLTYTGSSAGAGDPRCVSVRLEAVIDERNLYSLKVACSAQRKWTTEQRFFRDANRAFEFWCSKLSLSSSEIAWSDASPALLDQRQHDCVAREDALASVLEDPAPVIIVQQQVLAALRAGMGFFTAHKEGGTHLYFDGVVFRRADYGEEPNIDETYPDDAAMLVCLRQFFEWDARRDNYPHPVPNLAVWTYIQGRLRPRNS